jgi:hypothetical protein
VLSKNNFAKKLVMGKVAPSTKEKKKKKKL